VHERRPRIHIRIQHRPLRSLYICRQIDGSDDQDQLKQPSVEKPASHGNQLMDTLFVLGQESRLRILQRAAARVPGCAYLCAWAALPAAQPPASSSSAATRYLPTCCGSIIDL